MRDLCREHGCYLSRRGKGWRILGASVDVFYADLKDVERRDLLPAKRGLQIYL